MALSMLVFDLSDRPAHTESLVSREPVDNSHRLPVSVVAVSGPRAGLDPSSADIPMRAGVVAP